MSLHKLTAGSGYDYLTRQVAAMDSTEKGHTSLADYYSLKGEKPGHWVGSGLAGIDGLEAGDVVTADQMLSLFGDVAIENKVGCSLFRLYIESMKNFQIGITDILFGFAWKANAKFPFLRRKWLRIVMLFGTSA